ncbi:hypothetical protein MTR67_015205 [Solanum verrucosum]|uniref:Uncharacterized protein n=1 Tax=Solanum verrucosum TaxID=315347 RepID=A0AAF0TQA8_SOLVR|nr:hypothetical protein MTR67_015205 [Solanum verrucosum]
MSVVVFGVGVEQHHAIVIHFFVKVNVVVHQSHPMYHHF